jgi:hypothetical protein
MDVIDILVNEHRHIERVMDMLERAVEYGRGGGVVRRLLPVDERERVRAKFARIAASHGPQADAADALELAFPLPPSTARRTGNVRPQPWVGR